MAGGVVDEAVAAALAAWREVPGGVLPVLQSVQVRLGHVPEAALHGVAAGLGVSLAEVRGVLEFYPALRREPARGPVLQLCVAESCRARGAQALAARAEALCAAAGVELERVYCLGLCSCSPAAMLDGEPHGRLDEARLGALLTGEAAR